MNTKKNGLFQISNRTQEQSFKLYTGQEPGGQSWAADDVVPPGLVALPLHLFLLYLVVPVLWLQLPGALVCTLGIVNPNLSQDLLQVCLQVRELLLNPNTSENNPNEPTLLTITTLN